MSTWPSSVGQSNEIQSGDPRITQKGVTIIENKSKVQTSRNKPQVASASGSSTQDAHVIALTKQVEALLSSFNRLVNYVQNGCETCGGPHAYYECQAAGGYTQKDVYATTVSSPTTDIDIIDLVLERFADEPALLYSSSQGDDYDDLFDLKSNNDEWKKLLYVLTRTRLFLGVILVISEIATLLSSPFENEDKVFNPSIFILVRT
ncbi:hypothetical protein Tco_1465740 [Tanacetum coccineum]